MVCIFRRSLWIHKGNRCCGGKIRSRVILKKLLQKPRWQCEPETSWCPWWQVHCFWMHVGGRTDSVAGIQSAGTKQQCLSRVMETNKSLPFLQSSDFSVQDGNSREWACDYLSLDALGKEGTLTGHSTNTPLQWGKGWCPKNSWGCCYLKKKEQLLNWQNDGIPYMLC